MVSQTTLKCQSDLTHDRPKSKYAEWEEPPQEGEPFDYDAVPERFYFEVESAGNLEPDAIIQQGIKVLQQKLAAVIRDMTDGEAQTNGVNGGGFDAPRSPDMGMNGQGSWPDQGYTTPYGQNGGNAGTWGNTGAATPYGATPYGQNGQNGW
jgi:DNA-directed RNA polymerase II subunit RPB3